jgi:hypothetical protein
MGLFSGSAYAASQEVCDEQATAFADQQANPGRAAVAPGLIGMIAGLGISSANGNKHPGLAALGGGAVGAALGLAANQPRWQAAYDDAFAECMNGTNVKVVDLPPIGSNGWLKRCARKYRSFDPSSGYFTKYDGTAEMCSLP